jgi:hypothetical protein
MPVEIHEENAENYDITTHVYNNEVEDMDYYLEPKLENSESTFEN